MNSILAQILDGEKQHQVMVWGGLLMVAVVAGFGVILLIRRYLRDPSAGQPADPGFSLSELRAMRDRGEITPEEYENTRARVIATVKRKMNEPRAVKRSR